MSGHDKGTWQCKGAWSVTVMVVGKQDSVVPSQCKLRLPRMALILGSTSAVCQNDTVMLKFRAVSHTKTDNLTNTSYRNPKEDCNLINNCHQNLKTYLLGN
jgi:hypothetical protein